MTQGSTPSMPGRPEDGAASPAPAPERAAAPRRGLRWALRRCYAHIMDWDLSATNAELAPPPPSPTPTTPSPAPLLPPAPRAAASAPGVILPPAPRAAESAPGVTLPPGEDRLDRFLFGLAQPLLAMRRLLGDGRLLLAALKPAALLALFCGAIALLKHDQGESFRDWLHSFYASFALLAPVPSVLLVNHYARLAAEANRALGFGVVVARLQSLPLAGQLALRQLVVVTVAFAPILGLLRSIPVAGKILVWLLGGLWALHWIVVEALDSAAVLEPRGESEAQSPQRAPGLRPWFVRVYAWLADWSPPGVSWLLDRFAGLCEWLSRPWQAEIRATRRNPALMVGFALTTAALLATPVLNLLFRPIILIAAVHILGHLRKSAPHKSREPLLPFLPNLSLPAVPREALRHLRKP